MRPAQASSWRRSRTSVGRVASAMAATACTTPRVRWKPRCAKRHFIARAFSPQRKSHPVRSTCVRMSVVPSNRFSIFADMKYQRACTIRTTTPPPQAFAKPLREAGEWGLVYRSVRHEGGECIAAFKPQAVSIPIAGAALAYVWDGERISKVYEKVGSAVRSDVSRFRALSRRHGFQRFAKTKKRCETARQAPKLRASFTSGSIVFVCAF